MKVVKIEIIEGNNKKPEKYSFSGNKALDELVKMLNTKFSISIVDFEEVKKEN